MRVTHLSKDELTKIVVGWAKEFKKYNPDKKTHENHALQDAINLTMRAFPGLNWREDYMSFIQGL